MIRLIIVAGFALVVGTSAQAMSPAPLLQTDTMTTQVAMGCSGQDTSWWCLRGPDHQTPSPQGSPPLRGCGARGACARWYWPSRPRDGAARAGRAAKRAAVLGRPMVVSIEMTAAPRDGRQPGATDLHLSCHPNRYRTDLICFGPMLHAASTRSLPRTGLIGRDTSLVDLSGAYLPGFVVGKLFLLLLLLCCRQVN